MATLHSWKKVAAIMVAGSILTFASACTRAEEKVPEPTPETTQSQTVGPTDSTTVDKDKDKNKGTDQISTDGPFGYDFSNIPISDKIKEQYGKKASANILKDAFTPMEIMSTTTNIYAKGEKTADTYLPLKAHMTPEGWDRDSNKDEGGSVFPAMVLNLRCNHNKPLAQLYLSTRRAEYAAWLKLIPALEEDFERVTEQCARHCGQSPNTVTKTLLALQRLTRELPLLYAVLEKYWHLDFPRIVAIDTAMSKLGPDAGEEVISEIDAKIARNLTPRIENQQLPTPDRIAQRVRQLVNELMTGFPLKIHDPSAAR